MTSIPKLNSRIIGAQIQANPKLKGRTSPASVSEKVAAAIYSKINLDYYSNDIKTNIALNTFNYAAARGISVRDL